MSQLRSVAYDTKSTAEKTRQQTEGHVNQQESKKTLPTKKSVAVSRFAEYSSGQREEAL